MGALFKPEISFGQILQVIALLAGGFVFFVGYESRIATLEANVNENNKTITRILDQQNMDSDKINDLRLQMQKVGADVQSVQKDSAHMARQIDRLVEQLIGERLPPRNLRGN